MSDQRSNSSTTTSVFQKCIKKRSCYGPIHCGMKFSGNILVTFSRFSYDKKATERNFSVNKFTADLGRFEKALIILPWDLIHFYCLRLVTAVFIVLRTVIKHNEKDEKGIVRLQLSKLDWKWKCHWLHFIDMSRSLTSRKFLVINMRLQAGGQQNLYISSRIHFLNIHKIQIEMSFSLPIQICIL